uniref:C3H1-type domain-containing protein n=1 Tax=Dunaliella tertiolecta TaxID=3047 RepID=A0A7S3QML5_DUNTE|mmetsp:Transcript_17199/g.45035  ORF Transcript_17199/g.45035 Transcript_17199/m.45035 type:complete len:526 (-) Transcript_17199:296-1873(-)
MPEDDPSPQEQQRCPDPHGDVSKPEQSTESPSPPFMISNQGVNDQFFELLRHDAPLPQQQVLFNLSLPTRVTRTHSCDGAGTLGDAAGSHKNDADEQHMRSAFGVRKPVGSHPGSKSGDHAVAMSSMPLHQSLGKDLSLAAQLHSRQMSSAGVSGESQRRSSDPFLSHGPFSSTLSSLREGSSSTEFNSLKTRETSQSPLPPKAQPEAPEPAAPIDPGTGKQVCTFYMRTGTCAYRDRCKFHHPLNCPPPILNTHGYPLRAEESDCVHYTKKGWCAFGVTCKYNHPEGIAANPLAPSLATLGTPPHMAVAPVPAGMPSPMVFGLSQQPQLVLPQQQQQLQSMVLQQQQLQEPALWGSQPPQQRMVAAQQQQQQQQALYWAVASDPDSSYGQQQLPQPQPLMTQMPLNPAMQPSAYMPAMQPVTFPQQQQASAGQLVYAPAGMLTMSGGITGGQGMPVLSQGMPVLSQGLLALSEPAAWGAAGGGGWPVGGIQTASIEQAMAQLRLPSQVQHPDAAYGPEGGSRWM